MFLVLAAEFTALQVVLFDHSLDCPAKLGVLEDVEVASSKEDPITMVEDLAPLLSGYRFSIDESVLGRFSIVHLDLEQTFRSQANLSMVLLDADSPKNNLRGWITGLSAKVNLALCQRVIDQARHLLIFAQICDVRHSLILQQHLPLGKFSQWIAIFNRFGLRLLTLVNF